MRQKKKILRLLLLALVLTCCLALTGCGFRNKTLDGQMEKLVDVLNQDDYGGFVSLFHPNAALLPSLHDTYEELRDAWIPVEPGDLKLIGFNVSSAAEVKVYQGNYLLPRQDEYNALTLIYVQNSAGSGIENLSLWDYRGQNSLGARIRSASVVQCVWTVLCLGFVIFTIVDILRKRPKLFGCYLLLPLVYFTIRVFSFALYIPTGCIVYWCIRRLALQKKEQEKTAALSPSAWTPPPGQWQNPPPGPWQTPPQPQAQNAPAQPQDPAEQPEEASEQPEEASK